MGTLCEEMHRQPPPMGDTPLQRHRIRILDDEFMPVTHSATLSNAAHAIPVFNPLPRGQAIHPPMSES